MIETGISKMDELLAGGIPEGKSLVYYIQPGVEAEIFGLQTIYSTLKRGGTGVFVVSSESPDAVRDQFRDFGWCRDSFNDSFFFVDAYNPLVRAPSKEKYVISNPYNIEDISKTIVNLLKELPPSTIVFGSLSTIMDLCGEKETLEAVRTWNNLAKLHDHVMIYNFTAWSYSLETLDLIKKQLFNAVITIGGIAQHVIFSQYFGIIKLDWKKDTMIKTKKYISFIPACGMEIQTDKSYPPCLEYQIEGANVRIVGENYTPGFPLF